ncbi:tetratricopeptide repeat protein [Azospirillum doebereinerae]
MSTTPPQPLRFEEAAALAATHHREGRLTDALALYGPLQAARPTDPPLNTALGTVLAQLGRLEDAILFLSQAVRLAPDDLEAAHNLATALFEAGRMPEAAEAWNRFGSQLYGQRRFEEAVTVFGKALAAVPTHGGASANLGACLQALGRHADAIGQLAAVLRAAPEQAETHNNLGNALIGAGRLDDSIASYRRAIALRPDYFEAYSNLGLVLAQRGENAERGCYDKALALRPDFPAARWNLALCLLLNGDLARGWREYEWRWRWDGFGEVQRPFPQPLWQGEPPHAVGGVLLVTAEQGFGDTLQFARYLPLLVERGHSVVFETQVPLFTLLWHSLGRYGVRVVPRTESPARVHDDLAFARHVPLLSLPERFGTVAETIPAALPYLFAEPTRQALWAARLNAAAGPRRKVGLVWKGRPIHRRDHERSMPAATLAPLLAVAGIQFFGLHKNDQGNGQIDTRGDGVATPAGVVPLDDMLHDFSETAAALANLDLLITVDTAVAHLAGAMGMPVWVMLPFSPDWRWLLDRDDSLWYPSVTLFRQKRAGDWEGVAMAVAGLLSETLGDAAGEMA